MSEKKIILNPGFIIIPKTPSIIYSFIGSGIVFTVFDNEKKFGGASYFTKPYTNFLNASPLFAKHSFLTLIKLMEKEGGKRKNFEIQIFGGAENKKIKGFIKNLAFENIKSAKKIVFEYNFKLAGEEIGGIKGRKIMFNTKTGEIIIAKVLKIRDEDWYPK